MEEGKCSVGCVERTGGVIEKCDATSGSVSIGVIKIERASADGRVVAVGSVAFERIPTNRRIVYAGREAKKGVLSFCCVLAGIAAVRGRADGLCSWQEREAAEREYCNHGIYSICY